MVCVCSLREFSGLKGAATKSDDSNNNEGPKSLNKRRLVSTKSAKKTSKGGSCGRQRQQHTPTTGAVYTMGNSITSPGNTVIIYNRDETGHLTRVGTVNTGGLGNVAANSPMGPVSTFPVGDPLGSQNSLIVSDDRNCLLGVNAGSNSFTLFKILHGYTKLEKTQIVNSYGEFPVSIAQNDDLVYVLNA